MKKNKKSGIQMSTPKGYEFNKSYSLDPKYSKHYWDVDRNKGAHISFDEKLDIEVQEITELLKSKNQAYGNTALNPTNIFSQLDATEAICARIDDKLARIKNKGINDKTEDTVSDLIGYLLLLKMSL
tara:strand:+ start:1567 stop:1947 length:381 start_codon:yes stop_codon:yes gene_type:complete